MSFSPDSRSNLNLEQQRKRAKDLRRAHAAGSLDAAVRIARHLPRARSQSPDFVLSVPFTLSEAQHVIAREAGFLSWPKLKHQLESESRQPAGPGELLVNRALAGDDEGVQRLLTAEPAVSQQSIHIAAVVADAGAACSLLAAEPALANRADERRKWTPLIYLCRSKYRRGDPDVSSSRAKIAKALLDAGADLNSPSPEVGLTSWNVTLFDQEEWYPIDAAADLADSDVVRLFLDAGADVGKTGAVLSQAVRGGNVEVLRLLLAAAPPSWQVGWAVKACVVVQRPDMARILIPSLTSPRVPRLLSWKPCGWSAAPTSSRSCSATMPNTPGRFPSGGTRIAWRCVATIARWQPSCEPGGRTNWRLHTWIA